MGIFVDYIPAFFAGLSNIPTTLITTTTNVMTVTDITITNLGQQPIRINLQIVRTGTNPVTILRKNQYLIEPLQDVNIIKNELIYLYYSFASPIISDSLVCYSNGYTQEFDCCLLYTLLNELPM